MQKPSTIHDTVENANHVCRNQKRSNFCRMFGLVSTVIITFEVSFNDYIDHHGNVNFTWDYRA